MAQTAQHTTVSTRFATHSAPKLTVIEGGVVADVLAKRYYVHKAVPAKDARIGRDGRCDFVLQCFEVPEGLNQQQIRDLQLDEGQAVYVPYYGFIARQKGEAGITPGYMYARTDKVMQPAGGASPRIKTDTRKARYWSYNGEIQDYAGETDTMREIAARRYPARKAASRRNCICGG